MRTIFKIELISLRNNSTNFLLLFIYFNHLIILKRNYTNKRSIKNTQNPEQTKIVNLHNIFGFKKKKPGTVI